MKLLFYSLCCFFMNGDKTLNHGPGYPSKRKKIYLNEFCCQIQRDISGRSDLKSKPLEFHSGGLMASIQQSAQPENSQKVDWGFRAKRAGKPTWRNRSAMTVLYMGNSHR